MIKKKINILYVAHDANLYGSNQSLFYLICELRERYHIVPTVLVPHEGNFTEKLKKENIEYLVGRYSLWQAVYKSGFRFVVKSILRRTKNLIAWQHVKKSIRGKKFDLVHSNSSTVKIGAECAEYLGIPHIWHIREFAQEGLGMRYMYSGRYVRRKYNEATALITVSKGIEDKYRTKYPQCRIRTIYNGIPSGKFSVRKNHDIDMVNFCQVGYISEAKNSIQVLEACRILKEANNLPFMVNFVGNGDGDYYQNFISYIEENGLQQYIKLWGFQENIEKILPQMDVGIMSSRMEGFGRVTVEFMMSGMPVLGYASGGTLELVDDKKTGFLYHTAEELAHHMLYFIKNHDKVEEMGRNGHVRAVAEFTVAKNADLVYEVYQDILEKN